MGFEMKFDLKKWAIILYLFFLVFAPPIVPFNIIYILFLIAVAYFAVKHERLAIKKTNLILGIMIWCMAFFLNILINEVFSNGELFSNRITVLYQVFVLMPMQIICALFVVKLCESRNLGFEKFTDLCINAGLIECVLVVISFVLPNIRAIFIRLMVNYGAKTVYTDTLTSYRAYGFADTLLDTFGYGMGILAALCLLKDKISLKYGIFCGLFLFSTIVNSRTGIAIFLIAVAIKVVICIGNNSITTSKFLRRIGAVAFLCVFILIAVRVINSTGLNQSTTYKWIMSGFQSVYNFITHTESQYQLGSMQNSLLSAKFWQLPDGLRGLLFGYGHSCYGSTTRSILGLSSDVGYVNYIWICGIIGLIFLIFLIVAMFAKYIRHAGTKYEKYVLLMLILSFLAMFIKGNVITHTAGTALSILLLVKCMH